VNFPVEDGQLLTQGEILCREPPVIRLRMSKKRAEMRTINAKQTHRNKDEPEDGAEWLMISLTASISMRDEVFGRDTGFIEHYLLLLIYPAPFSRGLHVVLGLLVVSVNLAIYLRIWRRFENTPPFTLSS
jgi:hypothetical protein